jgi:hypothetical protein
VWPVVTTLPSTYCTIGNPIIECKIPFTDLAIQTNSSIKIQGFFSTVVSSSPCMNYFAPSEDYHDGCVPYSATITNYFGYSFPGRYSYIQLRSFPIILCLSQQSCSLEFIHSSCEFSKCCERKNFLGIFLFSGSQFDVHHNYYVRRRSHNFPSIYLLGAEYHTLRSR